MIYELFDSFLYNFYYTKIKANFKNYTHRFHSFLLLLLFYVLKFLLFLTVYKDFNFQALFFLVHAFTNNAQVLYGFFFLFTLTLLLFFFLLVSLQFSYVLFFFFTYYVEFKNNKIIAKRKSLM